MGTHSLVHFYDKDSENKVCTIYQQYDGYVKGVGKQIADLIKDMKIVNGYNETGKEANGIGCLAAQYIAAYKNGVGNIYLMSPFEELEEEYEYWVSTTHVTLKKEGHFINFTFEEFINFVEI